MTVFDISCVDDGLAHLAGNLARVLFGGLVALPVLLVMALGSSGVALARFSFGFSLSLTLANAISTITNVSTGDNLGVMTNNRGATVHLLRSFLTMSGDDVLTLLNISSIYNNIVFFMALLATGLLWCLMALPVLLVMALGSCGVALAWLSIGFTLHRGNSTIGKTGGQNENEKLHFEI